MRRIIPIIIMVFLTGCFRHIPYQPSLVEKFQERPENRILEFQTSKGKQAAFYLPPAISPEKPPKKIAILYPGIESVALGWLRFIDLHEDPQTAYLLIDYPGRGFSEGMMHPEKNFLNSLGALKKLAQLFGNKTLTIEVSLMGHSFGTGAALQFATHYPVKRIVLVAPFNTLRKAVAVKSKFLSILMPSQIDNREIIKKLLKRKSPPEITILHGTKDTSLPIAMGKELASIDDEKIIFHEFPDDDHVNILSRRSDLIFHSLNGQVE